MKTDAEQAIESGRTASRVRQEITMNNPPIEIGQIWESSTTETGKVLRRVMILASYPECGRVKPTGLDHKLWLYEEMAADRRHVEVGRLGICPEFNLRYIFRLVDATNT